MARKNGNSGSNQKHGRAAPRSEALSLVIDPDAHRALDAHCGANPRNEVCGVLVGFTGEENGRRWTRIVAIIEGKHAREEQMSVTFTHETWDAVHEALSRRTDKARVVGWYHTHPDFGIFYSAPDVFVHRNFFNARGHLVDCRYTEEPLRDDMPEARAAASTGDGAFTRSNLDSIEARLTEMDQRMGKLATMLMAVVPVVGLLALGAGLFLGRGLGSPHRFVLLDARGQQIGTIASVELVEATARAEEARLKEEAAKAKAKQRAEEKAEEKAAKEAAKDSGAEVAPAAAPAAAPAPAPAANGGAK